MQAGASGTYTGTGQGIGRCVAVADRWSAQWWRGWRGWSMKTLKNRDATV